MDYTIMPVNAMAAALFHVTCNDCATQLQALRLNLAQCFSRYTCVSQPSFP